MKQAIPLYAFGILFIHLCLYSSGQTSAKQYDDAWFSAATSNIEKVEYSFYSLDKPTHFKAVNHRNRISAFITPEQYSINGKSVDQKEWNVLFQLKSIGRKNSIQSFGSCLKVANNESSLSYSFSATSVQYINNEQGLRQNFIINKRPVGNEAVKVTMKIKSGLDASLNNNKLGFFRKDQPLKSELVYTDLNVWDADHKKLPATMQYDKTNSELSIIVDDASANYPVTIDPINQVPDWTTSADGLLSGLITNAELTTALYGFTVTSLGDVNGDGFGDVAISAPGVADVFSGSGTLAAVGAVFVYYGSSTGLHTTPDNILQPNTAVAGALFGFSVSAGDVSGDGKNDIIIGAPLDKYVVHIETSALGGGPLGLSPIYSDVNVTAGKVYIYKSENLPSAPNPSTFLQVKLHDSFFSSGLAGLTGSNINVNALFGFSVAATEDLNNDSKADIVVGSPSYLGTSLLAVQSGAAFVYYSDDLNTSTPVQLQAPSPSLLGLIQLPVVSSSSLLYGYSVDAIGDYNSDGYPDLIVGAPAGVDLSSLGGVLTGQVLGGSAYIYYGNSTGVNSSIGARLQASSSGLLSNAANLFGYKVKGLKNTSGSHNGNVMIGAPVGGAIPSALSLTIRTGNIQLFRKKPNSPAGVVIADQVLESPKSTSLLNILNTMSLNVLFGASFDNVSDINCDGYPDLVVGEPLSSGTNISQLQVNAVGGSAYVYYGSSGGTFNPVPGYTIAATYGGDFLSVNATALFGFSVAGVDKVKGPGSKPTIVTGSPSGALDFSSSLLNLGSTLNTLFSFVAGNNGLGKAYSFEPALCGSGMLLPANEITLTGQKQEAAVQLNWLSSDEKDISQYVLEKSTDGTYFSTMAYVFAKGNEGKNTYSMIDYHPVKVNYYRLRIIHKNNEYDYSSVIKINFDEQVKADIVVAPNPVISGFKLNMSGVETGIYTIEIKNSAGQLQQRKTIIVNTNNYSENMIRGNTMPTGVYYLNVYDKNSRLIKTLNLLFK
ncbi:MAG: hypothetical protein QM764_23875 [Chitinophagaceae bacterium]